MKFIALSGFSLVAAVSMAQTVTVSTAPQNAEQVFYRLSDDSRTAVQLSSWDIAFEVTGITGSVLVNTAKGMAVFKTPYAVAQWNELDTAGLQAGWPEQQNSEVNWSSGALNQGLTADPFDLGWGIYDFSDNSVTGDSIFVLRMADGSYKKFMVNGYAAPTNSFTFTLADLDGGSEQVGTLNRSAFAGKNFGYYSFALPGTLDLEPPAAGWDLLFTKYKAFVTQPVPAFYPVAGVLQNKQVTALQVDGVPVGQAQWEGGGLNSDMNIIGFDWKSFDMEILAWEFVQDRSYFVKDRSGNIWKLVFTGYGGGASGNFTFTKELVSALSLQEPGMQQAFVLAPNPVRDGNVDVLIDAAVAEARMDIIDAGGRIVREQPLTGLNGLVKRTVSLHGLSPGIYLVRLQGAGISAMSRLMVE